MHPELTIEVADELVSGALAGFNAHAPEAFASVMHDDVVLRHSAYPEIVRGRDNVKRVYSETFWIAFPDLTLELADGPFFHPSAPRMAIEWTVRGTHLARLSPPGLAATGRSIDVAAREILEVRGGRIQHFDIKIDMGQMLRQLGVLPAEQSRAERAVLFLQRFKPKGRRN